MTNDFFSLRLEVTRTGLVEDSEFAVPLMTELILDIPKETGIGAKEREYFHRHLDSWLNSMCKDPDQFGSHRKCSFLVEYRGDTEQWETIEETVSKNTRKTILSLVNNIVKKHQA
jgi:hypothetical protein